MRRKLELYGTLGPSDHDKGILKEMFHYGMTGIRLNLSHRSLKDCSGWLENLHEVSEELHIVPDLLVDLQGPELRIGSLDHPIELEEGARIVLDCSDDTAGETPAVQAGLSSPAIPLPACVKPFLEKGQELLLDDGRITLKVDDPLIPTARVMTGGKLLSRKSLALPGQTIDLPTLTSQDLENLSQLGRYRVTGVMLPFVRSADDLISLRQTLLDMGSTHVRIFATIENETGVRHLPSLLPHCDHIVIARGDLANSVSMVRLPGVQKDIAMMCRQTKTPFMVVTQLLASMEGSPVPTRAEVSDIFNAVLDGASSLMLTGETAVGRYPVQAMKVLSDVSFEALRYGVRPHYNFVNNIKFL